MDMNEENSNKNMEGLENNVISGIKSGQTKMRPKWRFVLQTALAVTAIFIILLTLIYLVSFIVFALHESGAWFAPGFGFAGWYAFFGALPWTLIFLSAVFIVLLALLLRRYRLGYQWPFIYLLASILFLLIGGCLLIVQTSLEHEVFSNGMQEQVPLIGGFYSGFGVPSLSDVHHGTIITLSSNGFSMQDLWGRVSAVIITSSTELPYGDGFMAGDSVIVFGERGPNNVINAYGVERLSPGE